VIDAAASVSKGGLTAWIEYEVMLNLRKSNLGYRSMNYLLNAPSDHF